MKRKLPVLVEQAVGSIQAESAEKGLSFERLLRAQTQPTCRPECDHCCYHPLEISLFEGIAIYRHLVAKGRWTPSLRKALEGHHETVAYLALNIWLLARIPCPLLVGHKCSVYEVRPFQCRTTWSVGDPHMCRGEEFGPGTAIVPRGEMASTFREYEQMHAKAIRLKYYTMPISHALLMAEKVVSGEVGLSDVFYVMFDDFRSHS